MRSLFSISNFKLFRFAGFWALLIILVLEGLRQTPLANQYSNHEVDRMITALNQDAFDAPVLILGDSVAGNFFRVFKGKPDRFSVFPSNQAIETTGQLFILERYLEKNPAPGVIAYMAGQPLQGDLDQVLTENFVQRVFTKWPEIAWMSAHKFDPAFALKSICYKLFPSYRYRLHLQEEIFGISRTNIYSGLPTHAGLSTKINSNYSLSSILAKNLKKKYRRTASEKSWKKILSLTRKHDILLYYYAPPVINLPKKNQHIQDVLKDVLDYSEKWPQLSVHENTAISLPKDHFVDGVHLGPQGYKTVRPLQEDVWKSLLTTGWQQELKRKTSARESVYSLEIREELNQPSPIFLEGFYAVEGSREKAFRWSHPTFSIVLTPSEPIKSLVIETAPPTRATTLIIKHKNTLIKEISLDAGAQTFSIELPDSLEFRNPQRLTFHAKSWIPSNEDNRELGIALAALEPIPATSTNSDSN